MKVKLKERNLSDFYVNRLVDDLHNPHKSRQIVSNNDSESRIAENVCVLSKITSVVEDVHVHSKISSVIEDTSIDLYPPILNDIPMSSVGISDVMDASMDSSTPTPDEIYIHKKNQKSQEIEVESILIVFSSSQSLEFLAMVHQVSSDVSFLVGV